MQRATAVRRGERARSARGGTGLRCPLCALPNRRSAVGVRGRRVVVVGRGFDDVVDVLGHVEVGLEDGDLVPRVVAYLGVAAVLDFLGGVRDVLLVVGDLQLGVLVVEF